MASERADSTNPQRRGFASVVLWSVIPAAFIGPGTVTSCLKAGQAHGTTLLWTMTFSVIACVLMQSAAARVASCSGRELAAALRFRHPPGFARRAVSALIVLAIGVGCAAYQAGNVIGASVGLELLCGWPREVRVGLIGVGAATLLFCGVGRSVKAVLSGFVAVMGLTFLIVAFRVEPAVSDVIRGSVVPVIPDGGLALVLALVGTTIVPYNLFLGSSLAIGKDPRDSRFGIVVAVTVGGIISAGILVAGAVVTGEFTFTNVAAELEARLGVAARAMFAVGLFAAGFTSAVTAPLAAALTVDALVRPDGSPRDESRPRFRAVWLGVLLVGVYFGLRDSRPADVILLAQAANGLLLPIVAIFLYRVVRDPNVVPESMRASRPAEFALLIAVGVTILLGLLGLAKALSDAGLPIPPTPVIAPWLIGAAAVVTVLLGAASASRRV